MAVVYVVGERVEGNVNGKWFPAVIERVFDSGETFDIRWIDGMQWDEWVSRYEHQHIRKVRGAPFSIGDSVMALGARGYWYPAIVSGVKARSIEITYYDGNEVVNYPRNRLFHIDIAGPIKHRFGLDETVIGLLYTDAWAPCRISAKMPDGYRVRWHAGTHPDGTSESRMLENEIAPAIDPLQHSDLRPGTRVLARDDLGLWHPARITAIVSGGLEITREDQGREVANVSADRVRPMLSTGNRSDPESIINEFRTFVSNLEQLQVILDDRNDKKLSGVAFDKQIETRPEEKFLDPYFQAYLNDRRERGELKSTEERRQLCAACESWHSVSWLRDAHNNLSFYECTVVSEGRVVSYDKSKRPLIRTLKQFMTDFPIIPGDSMSSLKRHFPMIHRFLGRISVIGVPGIIEIRTDQDQER